MDERRFCHRGMPYDIHRDIKGVGWYASVYDPDLLANLDDETEGRGQHILDRFGPGSWEDAVSEAKRSIDKLLAADVTGFPTTWEGFAQFASELERKGQPA